MTKTIGTGCIVLFGAFCAACSPASAQQWAKDMFKETSHDFGTLARGAKAEFAFTFENLYLEDVRIEKVLTTCGCAGVKFPTKEIKTYEKAEIVVQVDTRGFLGRKDATLTVKFDKPFRAEIPLQIHSYIRSDVVFQPGVVQFGSVRVGQSPPPVRVAVTYAGRDDWKITAIQSPQPYIKTQLKETRRGFGRVAYDLWVELAADAPPGYLSEQIVLQTNDTNPHTAKVPLAVEGVIESEVAVRPVSLTFLAVRGDAGMTRNIVVQGAKPFQVTGITCSDARFEWKTPGDVRKVHVIPVTFLPGDQVGKTDTRLRIATDLSGETVLYVNIHAEVGETAAETMAEPAAEPAKQ